VTVPSTDVRRSADVPLGRVLARTCAAEWTRLWTVRAAWWFLAAATVAMVGIGAIAGLEAAAEQDPPRGAPAWVVAAVATMPGQFALLALVVVAVTSDYATGGIVPTLQWTPRRGVLFLARTVVAALTATVLGALLASGSAVAAYAAARPGLTLPWDEGLDTLGTVAFVVAAGTALAGGLGFALRNTAGALVTVFLLMLVLPILLPQFGYAWLSAIAEVLPGSGAAFLLLGEVPGMTQASSVAALLGWAGGALLLGWLRLARDAANR
jgi:ABC-2 type transport system permease protein